MNKYFPNTNSQNLVQFFSQVKELQHDEDLFVEATCVWSDGRVHKAYPFMLYGGHFSSYIWWAKVDTVTRIATFSKLFLKSLEVTPMKNSLKLGKRKNVDTFNSKYFTFYIHSR